MTKFRCQQVVGATENAADTITLDERARHRRRMVMTSDNGIEFLLDLGEARLLRHGDGLKLDDGRVIEVREKPEPLYEVSADSARHLLIIAWQLGNRHLAAQLFAERIIIRRDRVIKTMLEGLGATIREIEAPFDPEGGAYDEAGDDHHSHGRDHHHHE